MKEVHNDVEIEPKLQPLTGEKCQYRTANTDPDAMQSRHPSRVRGFWTQGRNALFDTRLQGLMMKMIEDNDFDLQ